MCLYIHIYTYIQIYTDISEHDFSDFLSVYAYISMCVLYCMQDIDICLSFLTHIFFT